MDPSTIIQVSHLSKFYGRIKAVDDLDLSVPSGVCFGLLGPNGAGKTTLIEIIEDILPPTSGQVLFYGKERSASFREKIGIMFQQTALLSFLTVRETLHTFQSLYHDSDDIEGLLERCSLREIEKQQNDKISGGQRQRLLLALSLVNKPNLLFLDEPSTGLDPQARRNMWDIIRGIREQGKTIILTTHYMEEAQELCDEIAIMDHGKIIAQGTPAKLIDAHTEGIHLSLPENAFNGKQSDFPMKISQRDGRWIVSVQDINTSIDHLLKAGVDLSQMTIHQPNLETVFLNLTGRRLRD